MSTALIIKKENLSCRRYFMVDQTCPKKKMAQLRIKKGWLWRFFYWMKYHFLKKRWRETKVYQDGHTGKGFYVNAYNRRKR